LHFSLQNIVLFKIEEFLISTLFHEMLSSISDAHGCEFIEAIILVQATNAKNLGPIMIL